MLAPARIVVDVNDQMGFPGPDEAMESLNLGAFEPKVIPIEVDPLRVCPGSVRGPVGVKVAHDRHSDTPRSKLVTSRNPSELLDGLAGSSLVAMLAGHNQNAARAPPLARSGGR